MSAWTEMVSSDMSILAFQVVECIGIYSYEKWFRYASCLNERGVASIFFVFFIRETLCDQ